MLPIPFCHLFIVEIAVATFNIAILPVFPLVLVLFSSPKPSNKPYFPKKIMHLLTELTALFPAGEWDMPVIPCHFMTAKLTNHSASGSFSISDFLYETASSVIHWR